jgi:hypothetical protein
MNIMNNHRNCDMGGKEMICKTKQIIPKKKNGDLRMVQIFAALRRWRCCVKRCGCTEATWPGFDRSLPLSTARDICRRIYRQPISSRHHQAGRNRWGIPTVFSMMKGKASFLRIAADNGVRHQSSTGQTGRLPPPLLNIKKPFFGKRKKDG